MNIDYIITELEFAAEILCDKFSVIEWITYIYRSNQRMCGEGGPLRDLNRISN